MKIWVLLLVALIGFASCTPDSTEHPPGLPTGDPVRFADSNSARLNIVGVTNRVTVDQLKSFLNSSPTVTDLEKLIQSLEPGLALAQSSSFVRTIWKIDDNSVFEVHSQDQPGGGSLIVSAHLAVNGAKVANFDFLSSGVIDPNER